MQTELIYKILRQTEWDAFKAQGQFDGAPIDLADGYIHFSTAGQAGETADKHFSDEATIIILEFAVDSFGAALKWEPSRGGDLFPHLYGQPLNMAQIRRKWVVSKAQGGFALPNDIS